MNPLVQTLRPAYFEDVEKQLKQTFYIILYMRIMLVLQEATAQPAELTNAPEEPLRAAIRSGRVQYQSGIFSGEFSAAISKALRRLGASFDSRAKVYRLNPSQVPAWIMLEATAYQIKAKTTHADLLRILNETTEHLDSLVKDRPVRPEKSIDAIEKGFVHAAEAMKVSPKLTPEAHAQLKKEYTKNMDIYINEFAKKEIVALRERVETNALQGYRYDRLITSIKNRWSVSENKAAFLARQETSLFLAKFREKRFLDAGIRRYRWSTAHDSRVRHDHRELNGLVFSYDNPPVVDHKDMRRANPGADYNCRCVDIPVMEGLER